MPAMELTEIVAWALIAGTLGYAALRRYGVPLATITAGLAALATKEIFLGLG